ncbi:MAG: tail fiber domain-containing protein, partial [Betaproteobacteria bacterium]
AASGTAGNTVSFTQAMTLTNAGLLGLGTSSPSHTLDVNGSMQIERNGSSPLLRFTDTSSSSRWIGIPDGSSRFAIYGTNGSTEELVLDSSGNVGIGTSSPAVNFVVSDGPNTGLEINPYHGGLEVSLYAYDRTASAYRDLRIAGDELIFLTGSSPTATMTLESNGDILVNGATNYIQFGAGNNVLTDNDAVAIYGGGFIWSCRQGNVAYFSRAASTGSLVVFKYDKFTDVGSVSVTSTSTAYNTSSDYRLKENLAPITGAVDRVNALQPRRFNFIAEPDKVVDGFVAHEVSDIVPEAITGEKDAVDADGNPEYQGIDQSKLVPLLTAAIQELTLTTQQLTARIEALEAA